MARAAVAAMTPYLFILVCDHVCVSMAIHITCCLILSCTFCNFDSIRAQCICSHPMSACLSACVVLSAYSSTANTSHHVVVVLAEESSVNWLGGGKWGAAKVKAACRHWSVRFDHACVEAAKRAAGREGVNGRDCSTLVRLGFWHGNGITAHVHGWVHGPHHLARVSLLPEGPLAHETLLCALFCSALL